MDVKKKEVVCEAYRNKDLYVIRGSVEIEPPRYVESNVLNIEHEIWHKRFCHINNQILY